MSLYQFTKTALFLSIPCLVWFFYPSDAIEHEMCGHNHTEVIEYSQEEKEAAMRLLQPYFAQAQNHLTGLPVSEKHKPSVCFSPDTDPGYIEQFYKDFGEDINNSLGFGSIGGKQILNLINILICNSQ